MPLRNLPTEEAKAISSLINCNAGQVSSMALTRNAGFDMTLLAFAAGESVSEEEYFGDVMYYVLEGAAEVVLPNRRIVVEAGQVLRIEAHVLHSVEGHNGSEFKLLQINLQE